MPYTLSICSSPGIGPGTTTISTPDYTIRFELDAARGPIHTLSVHNEEELALCLIYFEQYTNPFEYFMALYRSERYIQPGEDSIILHPRAANVVPTLDKSTEPQKIVALEKIIRDDALALGLNISQ